MGHLLNVIFSEFTSRLKTNSPSCEDACDCYFPTVFIDTTICMITICTLLGKIDKIFVAKKVEFLKTGNYYKRSVIHKLETIKDNDGNIISVPLQNIESYEINYIIWFV